MQPPSPNSPALPLHLSAKSRRTKEQPINALVAAAMGNPSLINFAAGLVDSHTLPLEICAEAAGRILGDNVRGRAALQYEQTLGSAELRRDCLRHLEKLEGKAAADMDLTPGDLVITTGSQQALYIIGDVLVDPGDIVIAANPSYFVYTGTLQSLGAKVMTVPMDDHGMDVEAVDRLLARIERDGHLHRVRFIYCTSYFDNPTGLTLSLERRPRLLEIARKYSRQHRILILEDAAYRELRYDGESLPSIKSFDAKNEHTILACTFSKPFAPGIKTGYTAVPPDLMRAILDQKGNHDFGSASLAQHIGAEVMRSGKYLEQVEHLKRGYSTKLHAMLGALERYMPKADGLHWTRPAGGLYVWLTLPEGIDTSRDGMFPAAVEAGVLYVPGDYCFQPDEAGRLPTNHLRLCFGNVAAEQVEPGVQKLAGVVRRLLSGASPQPASSGSRHGPAARATV
ncbi:MAG TPA: PLP-dependent aminotransferase family protein [Tepidisphaeraceae bacterium]|nr:PLP-dependent aminotransferase family protein [Tepidisphaeraceae bacterium]